MEEHRRKVQRSSGDGPITYYPRLVSFVGNTSAGKSSLIEVLIGHLWDSRVTDRDLDGILVPVTGDIITTLPTSSDIHLYHDPIEAKTNPQSPLLFADCEGFEAANHSAAARSRAQSMKNMENAAPLHVRQNASKLTKWTKDTFNATMRFMTRNLYWSDSNTSRSNAVEELFPRLVYNVSDVVVYVVSESNVTSVGKILEKLVRWSQKAETSSVNRSSLPSLVVVINQCDPARIKKWGSDETTTQILEENKYLMNESETIRNRMNELSNLNLPHGSIKAILENSYAAVQFLRLPTAHNVSRLRSQFQELHAIIDSLAKTVQNNKKESNMLLSTEQLHHLYQLTFDHFSKSMTSPFDFMEAFFTVHHSPAELSGNFFELLQATFKAVKHGNKTSNRQAYAEQLVEAAVPLICSTIAMDSRRNHFPGVLYHIFRGDTSNFSPGSLEMRDDSYEDTVDKALREFTDSTIPCGYMSPGSSSEERTVCVNSKKAHGQGGKGFHQDASGVRFGSGLFDPYFEDNFLEQWAYALAAGLCSLETAELPSLWDLHRKAIRDLHDLVLDVNLQKLPSCVWCMRNFPTERLPCGHWICSSCMVEIGIRSDDDDRVFIFKLCDQHPGGGMELNPPFEFLNLPNTVGRRLLSLDEGGVRGILQLSVLAAIQDGLGEEIPVQDCFDLIGGAGIGGINALGLGIRGWHISMAIKEFSKLIPKVFVKQSPQSFIEFLWGPKYPYSQHNLIWSIQNAIGEDSKLPMAMSLVRLPRGFDNGPIRLFVASTRKGLGGMILTNYRRQATDTNQDQNQNTAQKNRKSHEYSEIYSVGEAAKATASFQPFFGPCTLNPGNDLHVGGAHDFACPAVVTLLEAQSLWPHMLSCPPDVLVSIGCGHKSQITSDNSEDCMGTEAMWCKAFGDKSHREPDRYIRLCREFSRDSPLPNGDDVSLLADHSRISVLLGDMLITNNLLNRVNQVTRRLISSIFYFDKASSKPSKKGGWIIYGHIRCRFKETSKITKAFGSKISSFCNLRFICGSEDIWHFDKAVLEVMTKQGRFRAPSDTDSVLKIWVQSEDKINIQLVADDFQSESISGSRQYQGQVPEDEVPEDEMPEDEVPEDEVPEDEVPEDEVPEEEVPDDEVPEDEKNPAPEHT
ncbi:hypothetical protein GQ53DRAFT_848627 [Thozetella sp. PMI_491]|nr:hypothetical protein GQ53DRAFT_848627 [Thozetella sp. PMI_491]